MDCLECHNPGTYHVPNKIVIEDVWTEDGASNAKDTYTAGDTIVAKVRFAVLGAGSAYVKTFQSRVKGPCGKILPCPRAETLMSGVHTWSWSGVVPAGCTGKGKVIMELKSYHYQGSAIISDVIETHGFTIA